MVFDVCKKKSMRSFFAILASISFLFGCRPSHPVSSGLTFGDGDAVLKPVLDTVLKGFDSQFAEISWSGGGGSGVFAVDDSLVVKDADLATIAVRLSAELDKLPAKWGWSSHGAGSRGNSHLKINYEEDGAQFYFDFLLTQKEKDVEILILHKGVQR